MSWQEACSLTRVLVGDPSSSVGAAVNQWKYPLTQEARVQADLFDLLVMINTEKQKRNQIKQYPRPWKTEKQTARSEAPTVGQEEIRAALAARRQ